MPLTSSLARNTGGVRVLLDFQYEEEAITIWKRSRMSGVGCGEKIEFDRSSNKGASLGRYELCVCKMVWGFW